MHMQTSAALERDMSQALQVLLFEAQRSLKENPTIAEHCIGRAVDMLTRRIQPVGDQVSQTGALAPWRLHRLRRFIEAQIDRPLSGADLASAAGLSASHFARAFKASLGISPHQYVMRVRIERAKALMLTTMDALSDIALACGLSDQSHFSRLFSKLEGEPPAAWRRRQIQAS